MFLPRAALLLSLALPAAAVAQTPPASPGRPGWLRTNTGCYVWSAEPQPHESATWTGACANRRLTGEGELVLRSGDSPSTYRGSFRNGVRNGHGVFTWPNGDRYEGGFRNDEFDGQGIRLTIEGDRYDGGWRNGVPHGTGRFTWVDSGSYEGDIEDGRVEGQGTRIWASGSRYTGQWHNNLPNGTGQLNLVNGNVYSGTWTSGCFKEGTRRAAALADLSSCP